MTRILTMTLDPVGVKSRTHRVIPVVALVVAALGCDRAPAPAPAPTVAVSPASSEPATPEASAPMPQTAATITAADGGFTVRYRTLPDPIEPGEPFVVEAEVFADPACTKQLSNESNAALVFDAAMPHHGHGMNVRPTSKALGNGRYRMTGVLFHMPGRWEVFFDRTVDGVTERAQATVEIADEARAPRAPR